MANQPKVEIAGTVDRMATLMDETSVYPLDDAATADFLVNLVCEAGEKLDFVQIPMLLSIAAQARLRARRVAPESEVVS